MVLTWFRLFATAFGIALMFGSLMSFGTDKAFCLLYALAEVVATTTVRTYPAFSSFPEPLCLVAPAAKGKPLCQDGVCRQIVYSSYLGLYFTMASTGCVRTHHNIFPPSRSSCQ
jgi:hypothetical protein